MKRLWQNLALKLAGPLLRLLKGDAMLSLTRKVTLEILGCLLLMIVIVVVWQDFLSKENSFVVYFGRPWEIYLYFVASWRDLLYGAISTSLIAAGSLLLSGALALFLLRIGLSSDGRLKVVERIAAISQTIPMVVIVLVSYIATKSVDALINQDIPYQLYCVIPVAISLFFPPLVYGAQGVRDLDPQMKALMRIWGAPQKWRIRQVYRYCILPHVLSGLRVSSTWAIAATLIAEGLMHGPSFGISNPYSLGYGLVRAFTSAPAGMAPAIMIIATLLGYATYQIVVLAQTHILRKMFGTALEHDATYPISER